MQDRSIISSFVNEKIKTGIVLSVLQIRTKTILHSWFLQNTSNFGSIEVIIVIFFYNCNRILCEGKY